MNDVRLAAVLAIGLFAFQAVALPVHGSQHAVKSQSATSAMSLASESADLTGVHCAVCAACDSQSSSLAAASPPEQTLDSAILNPLPVNIEAETCLIGEPRARAPPAFLS